MQGCYALELLPLARNFRVNMVFLGNLYLSDHQIHMYLFLQRGFCPLHLAAKRGRAEAARTLLQVMRPENVNAVGRNGLTPLHMAAHYNHVPLVELLLGFGAEADRAVSTLVLYALNPFSWRDS